MRTVRDGNVFVSSNELDHKKVEQLCPHCLWKPSWPRANFSKQSLVRFLCSSSFMNIGCPRCYNPSTPQFKKYILKPCISIMYKWGTENWETNPPNLGKLWKAKFLILCNQCYISDEAAGEIWNWSMLRVEGFKRPVWESIIILSWSNV